MMGASNNRLDRKQQRIVEDFLIARKTEIESGRHSDQTLSQEATRTLKFTVTPRNIRTSRQTLGYVLVNRSSPVQSKANFLSRFWALQKLCVNMANQLGVEVPPELTSDEQK